MRELEDYAPQLRRLIDGRPTLSIALTELRTLTQHPLHAAHAVSKTLGVKIVDARTILRQVPCWRDDMLKVDRDTDAFIDALECLSRELEREMEEEDRQGGGSDAKDESAD